MTTRLTKEDRQTLYAEITEHLGLVPEWIDKMPDGAKAGFWEMTRDFWMAETKLDGKTKELIGVAVAGATRCKYCAHFHTEAARLYGATDDEIAEASMMGAVTMLGSTFLNAQQVSHDDFVDETGRIAEHLRKQASKQAAASPRA
jgi:AhpD family alkylhydroperoxidase